MKIAIKMNGIWKVDEVLNRNSPGPGKRVVGERTRAIGQGTMEGAIERQISEAGFRRGWR